MDEEKKKSTSSQRITTKEQELLIIENLNLVHDIIKMYEVPGSDMYEETVSIGNIALVKAAVLFKPEKEINFITYASNSIKLQVWRYRKRQQKKLSKQINLNELILGFEDETELINMLGDVESDFTDEIHEKEWAIYILNIILNVLKPQYAEYMLYLMAGNKKHEIAEKMNFSRQRGVQIEALVLEKIHKYLKKPKRRQRRFRVYKELDSYKFVFMHNDSDKNIAIFKELCNNENVEKLSNCEIICDEKGVVIESDIEQYFFEALVHVIEIIRKAK